MSICDGCIHDDVCGLEDNHEEGIVSCADMIPKDVLYQIRNEITMLLTFNRQNVIEIIDKYRNEVSE